MSVLAIDIGSSRVKAALADWDGRLLLTRSEATPRLTGEPGEQAYPVEKVYEVIEQHIEGAATAHPGSPVDTIVFSCLGTAMAPVDEEGVPLGPALAPADARPQAGPWRVDALPIGRDRLLERTGSDPSVASTLLHALWWQAEHPGVIERAARFRSLRGYALWRLCGVDAEDRTWASRTMLADLETGEWSPQILMASGLPEALLPRLEHATTAYTIDGAATRRLGLASGAHAVMGAMDNCCALLGAAGPERSGLVNIVGTYEHMAGAATLEAVRAVAARTGAIIHRYLLEGQFITMTRVAIGRLLAAVAVAAGTDLDAVLEGVDSTPTGRSVPLEVSAVEEALAAGADHRQILQGLLESSASVLGSFATAWASQGLPGGPVVAVGGGVRATSALKLKANLVGRPFVTLASDEAASLGALRLAAMATRGASVDDACQLFANPVDRTIEPAMAAPAVQRGGVSSK